MMTVDYIVIMAKCPVVSDGMVFSVDKHHLYVFPVDDRATDDAASRAGSPCPQRRNPPTLPAGPARARVHRHRGWPSLRGHPTHCGTRGDGLRATVIGAHMVMASRYRGDVVSACTTTWYAYPIDPREAALDCAPLWIVSFPHSQVLLKVPDVDNQAVHPIGQPKCSASPIRGNRDGGVGCYWNRCHRRTGARRSRWIILDRGCHLGLHAADTTQFCSNAAFTTVMSSLSIWSVRLVTTSPRDRPLRPLHGTFLAAYMERCEDPSACKPGTLATSNQCRLRPSVTDRGVFSGADALPTHTFTVKRDARPEAELDFCGRCRHVHRVETESKTHRSREPAGAIVFSDRGDLYLIRADGTGRHALTQTGGGARLDLSLRPPAHGGSCSTTTSSQAGST